MTITLVSPTAGVRVGPNCLVDAQTDIASAVPPWAMHAAIIDPLAGEIYSSTLAAWDGLTSTRVAAVFELINAGLALGTAYRFGLADGAACSIRIQFTDGTGFVDDQIFPGFQWDPVTGLGALLGAITSPLVHDPMLDTILAAVSSLGPLNPFERSAFAPVVLANPYLGSGSIDLSGSVGTVHALEWQVASAPAGAGLTLGSLPEYEARVLQVVAYYRLADGSLVADVVVSAHTAQGVAKFGLADPDHLDYFVAPGYSINFFWVVP